MEDNTNRDELVSASLYFLQALGNHYGSESAMEAWAKIADTVDPDLKAEIFSAMLTGSSGGFIKVVSLGTANGIELIKAIRTYDKRRLGLKEGKDMWVALRDRGEAINLQVEAKRASEARNILRGIGCNII